MAICPEKGGDSAVYAATCGLSVFLRAAPVVSRRFWRFPHRGKGILHFGRRRRRSFSSSLFRASSLSRDDVSRAAFPPPSFPTHEDILQKLLRDQPVRSGRALGGRTVKSTVDGVELRAELAPHIEPPVADEDRLAELRAVRTEKRCLSAVYVAIMPRLASRLYVGEEAGEGLVVAVEIRVGHLTQHRIIRAWPTCNYYEHCEQP